MSTNLPRLRGLSFAVLSTALSFASSAKAELVITFGGDLNLTQSRAYASPSEATKHASKASWSKLFSGLAPELTGHLNFANLETVVSANADLADVPEQKYAFRAHPKGVEAAIKHGFNVFSMANNHSGDYGQAGIEDTIRSMNELTWGREVYTSGLGMSRAEALQPTMIRVPTNQGVMTVAFIAMTGVMRYDYRARDNRAGVLHFYTEADFKAAMKALREAPADYRILSVHWGREGSIEIETEQRRWAHRALKEGDVDLILGHHPHRVRPVERVGHRLIYYSLGNYLMIGAANLNGLSNEHNYGLMGKLYLSFDQQQRRLVPQAAEVLALTDLHFIAKPLKGAAAQARLQSLNAITARQLGDSGLRFSLGSDRGATCLSSRPEKRAASICANIGRAIEVPASAERQTLPVETVPRPRPKPADVKPAAKPAAQPAKSEGPLNLIDWLRRG